MPKIANLAVAPGVDAPGKAAKKPHRSRGEPGPEPAVHPIHGRVAERFKAPVLKTGVRETVPWVRIPPLPPNAVDYRTNCSAISIIIKEITSYGASALREGVLARPTS